MQFSQRSYEINEFNELSPLPAPPYFVKFVFFVHERRATVATYVEIARQVLAALEVSGISEDESAKPAETAVQDPDAEAPTFSSWPQWKAWTLNQLFAEQGLAGEPGRITSAAVHHGERDQADATIQRVCSSVAAGVICPACGRPIVPNVGCGSRCVVPVEAMPADPRHPNKRLDPRTGILPISEWGAACRRGFVSDSRFGSGPVVPRTNRGNTRKWRQIQTQKGADGAK
jgi:hypothetical protein